MNIDTQWYVPMYTKEVTEPSPIIRKYFRKMAEGSILELEDKSFFSEVHICEEQKEMFVVNQGRETLNGKFSFPCIMKGCVVITFKSIGGEEIRVYEMNRQIALKEVFYLKGKKFEEILGSFGQEKIVVEKGSDRINKKTQRKVAGHLIHRVKKESSKLIPLADEEMAEMVDAIRRKSHESYNDFISGKIEFEVAQGVLEEAVSDLLALKEMAQPKNSDSITFYDILGVEADDSKEEISKAYKNLIRLIHPDTAPKGADEAADNITSLVNSAYENLERRVA